MRMDRKNKSGVSDLAIVIPAYNEQKRIKSTLVKQVEQLGNWSFQIVVCDDGSSDSTSSLSRYTGMRLGVDLKVIWQEHAGRGEALRRALSSCESDYIVFSSADIVLGKEEIQETLAKLGRADLVMFSKVAKSGGFTLRWVLSRGFAWLVRLLFHVPFYDTQGVKVMERLTAVSVMFSCKSRGFFLDAEFAIVAWRKGLRILEQPWRYSYSLGSKVTVSAVLRIIVEMVQTRVRLT